MNKYSLQVYFDNMNPHIRCCFIIVSNFSVMNDLYDLLFATTIQQIKVHSLFQISCHHDQNIMIECH